MQHRDVLVLRRREISRYDTLLLQLLQTDEALQLHLDDADLVDRPEILHEVADLCIIGTVCEHCLRSAEHRLVARIDSVGFDMVVSLFAEGHGVGKPLSKVLDHHATGVHRDLGEHLVAIYARKSDHLEARPPEQRDQLGPHHLLVVPPRDKPVHEGLETFIHRVLTRQIVLTPKDLACLAVRVLYHLRQVDRAAARLASREHEDDRGVFVVDAELLAQKTHRGNVRRKRKLCAIFDIADAPQDVLPHMLPHLVSTMARFVEHVLDGDWDVGLHLALGARHRVLGVRHRAHGA
mmetsp:Transcript_54418/g.165331  ORF Transcript_54418/g.165331 Transcript_54418/m.165331 type:complete len:293 (+) Transcript_54418:1631-2509(+)